MDNISRISLFIEVVKHGSFTKAARSLGMTGPAISKQVKKLEQHLGVQLLNRTTRKVTLTEEGLLYSLRAKRALEDLKEAEHQVLELKSSPTGSLKVSIPTTLGHIHLAKSIAAFAKKYPNISMNVDFDDRKVNVTDEEYDVVLRAGAMMDTNLTVKDLGSFPICFCASPEYINTYGLPDTPSDLHNFPAITFTKHGKRNEWRTKSLDGSIQDIVLKSAFEADNSQMMVEACLQGVGLTALPIFSVKEHLESNKLVRFFPDLNSYPQLHLHLLYPESRYLSFRVRLFIDWITDYCQKLSWLV